MTKKQIYTEEQVNGLLDKMIQLKAEHDAMRIEIALLRELVTSASLSPDYGHATQPRSPKP
jgi:hypothetical protein